MERIAEILCTPITHECDVLVAGIAAALAAARQGARVILLEKQFMLVGLATAGLVTIYLPLCDGKGHQVSFGIVEELFRLSIKYGYSACSVTMAGNAPMTSDKVSAVIVENKSGRTAIKSKSVVDATLTIYTTPSFEALTTIIYYCPEQVL